VEIFTPKHTIHLTHSNPKFGRYRSLAKADGLALLGMTKSLEHLKALKHVKPLEASFFLLGPVEMYIPSVLQDGKPFESFSRSIMSRTRPMKSYQDPLMIRLIGTDAYSKSDSKTGRKPAKSGDIGRQSGTSRISPSRSRRPSRPIASKLGEVML
jgi:hypothetical protein